MNYKRRWSMDDERYIMMNAQTVTDETMAIELGRTTKAVKTKRAQLSIYRPKGPLPIWTGVHDMRMREMVEAGLSRLEIASALGVGVDMIHKHITEAAQLAGQGKVYATAMAATLPRWYHGDGNPVRTAHEYVDSMTTLEKLRALSVRRGEIVAAMASHAERQQKSSHDPHQREWMKLHEAYRDVRVAIDAIGRGAWPVTDGQA